MSNTIKKMSDRDANQTHKLAFNDVDDSVTVNGFLVAVVGRKVTVDVTQTNVTGDTEIYTFLENGNTLYIYKIIYTDGTRANMSSAERIA